MIAGGLHGEASEVGVEGGRRVCVEGLPGWSPPPVEPAPEQAPAGQPGPAPHPAGALAAAPASGAPAAARAVHLPLLAAWTVSSAAELSN